MSALSWAGRDGTGDCPAGAARRPLGTRRRSHSCGGGRASADRRSADSAAEVFAALSQAGWTGEAADAFRTYAREQLRQEETVAPALRVIADALAEFATELRHVQEQARAGIALARGAAQQPSPDPTSYDAGLAEVAAAWQRYGAASEETAARIGVAEAALPTPDAVRHPQPARAPEPWFDKVGDWFEDRADDVERELHDAAARAKDFLEYLAEHPDAVADLSRDGAMLVLGAFFIALGLAGEGAGLVLDTTGVAAPGGIALNLASAETLLGGISIAGGALAAAKDLGKAYADSDTNSSSGEDKIPGPRDFDPRSLRGMTRDEVEAKIPDDWQEHPSRRGDGVIYRDPQNRGRSIRLMNGYSPYE